MAKRFISDQSAFDLTYDIANAFRNAGDNVHLVSGRFGERLCGDVIQERITPYDKSSAAKRIYTWLKGTWDIFRVFSKNKDAELFIISNPPPAPLLPLLLKNRFSLLVWDIWPDALVHTQTLSAGNPLVRFWRWLNKKAFARADKIFTISEGLANALEQYVSREKIVVIPNWADTDFLKPLPKSENRFLREQDIADKFVVMYSGNIGNTHPVDKLVDVAAALQAHPDIVFVIIGEGGKKEAVRKRILETGVKNILLLPYQPYDMLPHSLAAADIGVITLEVDASQVSVPSKTYSTLAVGAPLLCLAGENSELANLVREHDVGEIFAPDAVPAIARWIIDLKNDPARREKLSAHARETSFLFTPKNAEKYVTTLTSNP